MVFFALLISAESAFSTSTKSWVSLLWRSVNKQLMATCELGHKVPNRRFHYTVSTMLTFFDFLSCQQRRLRAV